MNRVREDGGCPQDNCRGEGGHTWRESQEFNLKYTRFEMTIKHLSGNIELAFGSMRTEV